MPTWLMSALFALVVGIIGYFLKRTLNSFEEQMGSVRNDFLQEMGKLTRRVENLEEFISQMPYRYTMKEDFIRSMSSVDRKLDKIIENQRKGE